MYTGIETQDNTGNTGSEHGKFGEGQDYARILYYKQEIGSGLDDN